MYNISDTIKIYLLKGFLSLIFILLCIALIISWNTPTIGYESSIYWSTPLILWVSIITSMITGISLVIFTTVNNKIEKHHLWIFGFIFIIICYAICLSIFRIRGYYMWCMTGDPASHIGWINEIINSGYAPTSLIYPITHVYISEIYIFTDLNLSFLHQLIPFFFGIFCILFMYILANTIFKKNIFCLVVSILCCCLAYSWYHRLTPNILANFYLPFVLFLVYKNAYNKKFQWTLLLCLILILMPAFHTIPVILIFVVFTSILISQILTYYCNNNHQEVKIKDLYKILKYFISPFSILIIVWFLWFSQFKALDFQIQSIYDTITLSTDKMWLNNLMEVSETAGKFGYNVIEQIIRNLWGQIILGLMSILSIPLMIRDIMERKINPLILSLYITFFTIIILAVIFWRFNLAFTPYRLLYAISLFGTFLSAYLFSYILQNHITLNKNIIISKYVNSIFVIMIISILFIGGLVTLYPSPYILSGNWQNTHYEVDGLLFVLNHRDVDTDLIGITSAPGRFAQALLSPKETISQKLPMLVENQTVPNHFGYVSYPTILSTYNHETDLIITQKDKRQYIDVLPELASTKYTRQDFFRLNIDPTVNCLYSNGEFDYFKIK